MDSEHEKAFTVARIYFQNNLSDPAATAYIEKRGLSSPALRAFEIGYAPNQWRGLVDHYSSHKIRLAALDAGLFTTAANSKRLLDFFRDRLIFPIRDDQGSLVGYGGRMVDPDSDSPKYLNTPETQFFNKSEILYGLHQNKEAIQQTGNAVLVEGYMDVVALHSAGLNFGVAPMGTAITPEQIGLLHEHGVKTLWLCLDGDKAGERAAERTVEVILEQYRPELEIRVIALPDGHDPDSFIRAHGSQSFEAMMDGAQSLPSFIGAACLNSLGKPGKLSIEDKAQFVVNLKPFMEKASGALRSILVEKAAEVTGLDYETLAEHIGGENGDGILRQWSPHVMVIARALLHDQASTAVDRFIRTPLAGDGLSELQALQQHLKGEEPAASASLMLKFASIHGPLTRQEEVVATDQALRWLKQSELANHLDSLKSMPFDHQPKDAIKSILSMR